MRAFVIIILLAIAYADYGANPASSLQICKRDADCARGVSCIPIHPRIVNTSVPQTSVCLNVFPSHCFKEYLVQLQIIEQTRVGFDFIYDLAVADTKLAECVCETLECSHRHTQLAECVYEEPPVTAPCINGFRNITPVFVPPWSVAVTNFDACLLNCTLSSSPEPMNCPDNRCIHSINCQERCNEQLTLSAITQERLCERNFESCIFPCSSRFAQINACVNEYNMCFNLPPFVPPPSVCQNLTSPCLANSDCCSGACAAGVCCNGVGANCSRLAGCCSGLECVGGVCCSGGGSSCSSDSQCCTGPCVNGRCCGTAGVSCSAEFPCCSALSCINGACCKPSGSTCFSTNDCCSGTCLDGICCNSVGGTCAVDIDCCSGSCMNGTCCNGLSGVCTLNSDCCLGTCPNGTCCNSLGGTCGSNTDCCSQGCFNGSCCLVGGSTCTSDSQCCSTSPCTNGICCIPDGAECFPLTTCCSGVPCLAGTCG